MVGFELVSWENLFFYWFQSRNILVDGQNFRMGGDVRKSEDQISRAESLFFFFISQNLCHILTLSLLFLFLQILH